MKYSLLAMDLDGTLLNTRNEISAANIAAIQEFRRRGGKAVICSGRSPLSTRWIAATVGLAEPIIAYNGAIILEADGRILERTALAADTILLLLEQCRSRDLYIQLYEGDALLIPERNQANARWIENNIPALAQSGADPGLREDYRRSCSVQLVGDLAEYVRTRRPEIAKVAIFERGGGSLEAFARELEPQSAQFEISSSLNFRNLEIAPAGISKASSLLRLAGQLGIPVGQVAAIGDNYNDLGMLGAAGLGIAMGNAPEPVRAAAGAVTATNDDDGLALAIRTLLMRN